jgi:hypothetical protein
MKTNNLLVSGMALEAGIVHGWISHSQLVDVCKTVGCLSYGGQQSGPAGSAKCRLLRSLLLLLLQVSGSM